MKIARLFLAITIAAFAAEAPTLVKVEAVCPPTIPCPAVTPGTKIKATLSAVAAPNTSFILFVDEKPFPTVTGTLEKDKPEVSFELDKKTASTLTDLFSSATMRKVSIGPPAGPALASNHQLKFEPPPRASSNMSFKVGIREPVELSGRFSA